MTDAMTERGLQEVAGGLPLCGGDEKSHSAERKDRETNLTHPAL